MTHSFNCITNTLYKVCAQKKNCHYGNKTAVGCVGMHLCVCMCITSSRITPKSQDPKLAHSSRESAIWRLQKQNSCLRHPVVAETYSLKQQVI